METSPLTRVERRKLATRTALIKAAQQIFAEQGLADASIQEITDAADVGFGSFYNHFGSKTELFEAAIAEMFDEHATWLDERLAGEPDPAVVFTTSMRLTGRLLDTNPQMARIIMHSLGSLLSSPRGHAPRALRDIEAAVAAGRFQVDDPLAALACTAGALVGALHLMASEPDTTAGDLADRITFNILIMFRVDEAEARRLVALPLPDGQSAVLPRATH